MILNISHRGYSGKYDENTMIAFKKAIEFGADGIETDVQLSKDGIPVIIHDETLERTMNGKGFVKDYSLNELKSFRSKNNHEIPTLEELIILFKDSSLKVLNIELKNSIIKYHGLEEIVLDLIRKYNIENRVIISSFNHYSLLKVKALNKNIITGALTETTLVNVHEYLKNIKCECYHPYYYSIFDENIMNELKENYIKVNPYTINNKIDMKKAIEFGVTSIITNEIELLNELKYELRK
ncbi:glycerophosphodiester phosphodiesterase [Clostridium septicum]|uniref:Glycerophosphodiester phosphodiesterase n=1 Tax=Clostridium septicum TaxID=1504 RepID=A0A9N7JKJ6_CLOSE|nr:glycerophosphodiester phosphodiesterase [Clostridium septicum]AYE33576.1 glycerophosphodiester phosphodiesterase [Clostridium septicum]MDU1312883.1 glycerophosphodiester phosphodiesterase [Clostridium septicum]QAS61740.1 glycerophosphodiester phosphodiesterase [Clostridium septicum]UEC21813.1 glycerophosphodiester phosphodiesterase [Clostridium septicum]USS00135.1 glycerophosphodiester phosphodiesterase [Clostridium septicum]